MIQKEMTSKSLPRSQAEAETEDGSTVAGQAVKRRGIDVDVFTFDTPLHGATDRPARITASDQQEGISADGRQQDKRGEQKPFTSLHAQPLRRTVDVPGTNHACSMEKVTFLSFSDRLS